MKTGPMLDSFTRGLTPRKVQIDTLERIHQALVVEDKRVFVFDGPTGCGKSEIGMAVSRHYGNAFITSPLNFLVDQYDRDFPELRAVKGKANYICSAFPFQKDEDDPDFVEPAKRTCELGNDKNEELHREICRDYIPIRNQFWRGPLSVTNVDFLYWAHMPDQLEGGQDHRSVLIVDECHGLEGKMCELGKVQITLNQMQRVGMPGSFALIRDHASAQQFVEDFLSYAEAAIEKECFKGKERRAFARKAASLQLTLEMGEWFHWHERDEETGREALMLKPLNGHLAASRLFQRANKLVFMSATVGKVSQFLAELNIPESDVSSYCAGSDFPVKNRGIQLFNYAYMTRSNKATALPRIIEGCQDVLAQCPEVKGLILVPSYQLSRELALELGPRILTHTPDNKNEVFLRHCQSPEPTVLIGVFMHEGFDFKDDSARFLILPKTMYPYLGDPYIRERADRSQEWYDRQAVLNMVQAAGRVVRSETDHAEIVIMDSCFKTLLDYHQELFPQWFLDAIEGHGKKLPQSVPSPRPPVIEVGGS